MASKEEGEENVSHESISVNSDILGDPADYFHPPIMSMMSRDSSIEDDSGYLNMFGEDGESKIMFDLDQDD